MSSRLCFPYEEDITENVFYNYMQIYNHMKDDISREIYTNRLLYSITEEQKYLSNIVYRMNICDKYMSKLFSAQNVYVYGAGIRGTRIVKMFPNIKWKYYVDRKGGYLHENGIEVINLSDIDKIYKRTDLIVISNLNNTNQIVNDLTDLGVLHEDIVVLNDIDRLLGKNVYVDKAIVESHINPNKGFVDVGCFDGSDTLEFINRYGTDNTKYYAFEPNLMNYNVCVNNLSSFKNVNLFNIGLGNESTKINMDDNGEMSHISENGNNVVHVNKMDDILKNELIGFIKMDVEGFELPALEGAHRIIKEQHPILAISVYHKRSDIINIPKFILECDSNYYFYIRHYSISPGETVLYAVYEKNA